MNIKEYLKNNILLTDGAMGTYYCNKVNNISLFSEKANIENPKLIKEIHEEYIEAGAKLIRTNTFSANKQMLNCSNDELKNIIHEGFTVAKNCARNKGVFVACSIGPILEEYDVELDDLMKDYYYIIDCFLELNANIFIFETFSHAEYIENFTDYILSKNSNAEIIAQFSINSYGYSKKGISINKIIDKVKNINGLTAYGFNCSIGAGHMYNILRRINIDEDNIVAIPNAGYPEKIYDRTIYMDNADYFSDIMIDVCKLGIKIIGGCCGTTPKHISLISEKLKDVHSIEIINKSKNKIIDKYENKVNNSFYKKLENNEFVIAVEVDPPFGYDISKLMEAANILKAEGADIITIADSPLGKARLDSIMMAIKISKEVCIEVMPHICCRDKNIIAIKSQLLTAHVEGIRNFLLVTGDSLPDESRNEIKSVFNMNSIQLMKLVKELNNDVPNNDLFIYGGALNPKMRNIDRVIDKVLMKKEAGAKYLLTQSIYNDKDIENIRLIKEKTGMKILGGILPLVSYRNATFIHNEFAGMDIPEHVINQFNPNMTREEAENVGINISVKVANNMKTVVDGLYFMTPFNRATMIAKILKENIEVYYEKEKFYEILKKQILLLDGATGTELQKVGMPKGVCPEKWIVENKDIMLNLQTEYIKAGSKIIYAPTFGANRLKLSEYGLESEIISLNKELVNISKKAASHCGYVAGDLAPTGKSIYPVGEYSFEEIVDVYKEQVKILVEAGVDLFVIETMMSILEAKAALLAVKESCDLPVMVSMTFEKNGRTLNGTDPISALITLQNLGADAVGCNCSTGPNDMLDIVKLMKPYAIVPLLVKPNAGLPKLINGETVFDMKSKEFAKYATKLVEAGANIIGGCCGTNPKFISKLNKSLKKYKPLKQNKKQGSVLSSERGFIQINKNTETVIVGERINPTGKKQLQSELKQGNIDYIMKLAKEQIRDGAKILDVNVGMNGIDETEVMEKVISNLSTVVNAPLCIDSSNVKVIERALRLYPGRALVNSISLEEVKIKELLPIAAKYGAMFILLPLSDKGLPKTIKEKHNIIKEIYKHAKEYEYKKEDIIVDGLVTTVASNNKAAMETLETIEWCTNEFGTNTIMGLSNISFGLPNRQYVNTAFLSMAITKGLTTAIANPSDQMFMSIKYATDLLKLKDKDSLNYISYFNTGEDTGAKKDEKSLVFKCVLNGEKEQVVINAKKMLEEGISPKEIVDNHIISAITKVGEKFESKEYFLPQLIRSAETMEVVMKLLEPMLFTNDDEQDIKKPKVILATVKGDVHDIGKNLVGLMLKNHGFEVIDLGKDVDGETIIEISKEVDADIIGLSALMTTTMTEMEKVIERAKEENIRAKIMIGGAVITKEYADEIGVAYSKDANEAAKVAKELINM